MRGKLVGGEVGESLVPQIHIDEFIVSVESIVEIVSVDGLFESGEIFSLQIIVLNEKGSGHIRGEIVGERSSQSIDFFHLGDFNLVVADFSDVEEIVELIGTNSIGASETNSSIVVETHWTGIETLQVEIDLTAQTRLTHQIGLGGLDVVVHIQVGLALGSAIQENFIFGEDNWGHIVGVAELEQLELSVVGLVVEMLDLSSGKQGFICGAFEEIVSVGNDYLTFSGFSDESQLDIVHLVFIESVVTFYVEILAGN